MNWDGRNAVLAGHHIRPVANAGQIRARPDAPHQNLGGNIKFVASYQKSQKKGRETKPAATTTQTAPLELCVNELNPRSGSGGYELHIRADELGPPPPPP